MTLPRTTRGRLELGAVLLAAAAFWTIAGLLVIAATGCAVGRNELTGEVVLGFGAGKLIETANQGLGAAGDVLLGPLGLGGLGLGGLAAAAWRQQGVAKAKHEGENEGWTQAAATYSAPPPMGAAPPVHVAPPEKAP